ncbi:4342_t:CDS:2 [Rhizophagus irregularis]|nr:4342_t:CDS:2 [Rhizophagus irregularis]
MWTDKKNPIFFCSCHVAQYDQPNRETLSMRFLFILLNASTLSPIAKLRQRGRSSYPCCYTTKLSIFFGGEYSDELEEIKAITIADFLKNTLQFPFKHIKKKDDWGFGFVHFENEVERDNFFNYVKEQSFTGSRGKILNFNRAKAKKVHYRDDDIEVQPLLHIPSQSQSETLQSQTSQSQTSQMQLQLQLQTSQTSQSQTSQSQLQTSPQYNIFESSDELIVYIQAITVEKNSIEIETNNFEARNIYVKFKYNQEIEAGLQCKKGSFHILKDEIEISIHLPKRFDPEKETKVELLCGIIKISLGKLEKPIIKKYKIN